MAILGHHKKMNQRWIHSTEKAAVKNQPLIRRKQEGIVNSKKIFKAEGYDFPVQLLEFKAKDNPYERANVFLCNHFPKMFGIERKQDAVRPTYLLLKAILHYADWYGSAGVNVNYSLKLMLMIYLKTLKKDVQRKN